MVPPATAVQPATAKATAQKWWGKIRFYLAGVCVGLLIYAVYALKLSLDLVTGVALITLLFMMLQTEHERCDRARAGWLKARAATFAATSAYQWAHAKRSRQDEEQYADAARQSLQKLYATILLYGKGPLVKKYRSAVHGMMNQQPPPTVAQMIPVFGALDGIAEQKFKTWKLVWL